MMKKRLVIFDLDGTLIDAYPAIVSSFNYVRNKLGLPSVSSLIIRRAVGKGDENLIKPFVPAGKIKEAIRLYRSHHKLALLHGSSLLPGAAVLLKRLKAKQLKLAVASNRPTRFSRILIKHLKISDYFDYVLCADKLENGKPHPQILLAIMKKMKVSASDTIYVGDMTVDAQAGRRAGVDTYIVTTGSSSKKEIGKERPARILNRVDKLLAFIG